MLCSCLGTIAIGCWEVKWRKLDEDEVDDRRQAAGDGSAIETQCSSIYTINSTNLIGLFPCFHFMPLMLCSSSFPCVTFF